MLNIHEINEKMIRRVWSEAYEPCQTINSKTYNTQQTIPCTKVYVLNCIYDRCISNSNGGAITSTSYEYFLIEETTFQECQCTSGYGGAIYLLNGNCDLYKICGKSCNATAGIGQFAYINSDATNYKHTFNYSSLSFCTNEQREYISRHTSGTVIISSLNSSFNSCKVASGIYYCPFTQKTSLIEFSFLSNNSATRYYCIYLDRSNALKKEVKSCNIIYNSQNDA